ncbi:hypothetical protein V6N13_047737 [Hibiscus sabdariffa]
MLAAAATTAGPPLHHTSYTLQYMDKFSRHREVETWQTPPVPLRTDNIVNPPGTLASIRRDDNPKYRFGKIAGDLNSVYPDDHEQALTLESEMALPTAEAMTSTAVIKSMASASTRHHFTTACKARIHHTAMTSKKTKSIHSTTRSYLSNLRKHITCYPIGAVAKSKLITTL